MRPLSLFLTLISLAASSHLNAALPDLISEYRADAQNVRESFPIPWSETLADREDHLTRDWLARLDTLPWDALSIDDKIDWHLLRAHLRHESAESSLARQRLAQMEPLLPFRKPIQQLATARLQRTSADPESSAAALATLSAPLKSLRDSLAAERKAATDRKESPPIPPSTALRAAAATDAIRESLEAWFRFHDGFQPDFSWWVRQPYASLRDALEAHAKFLREDLASQKGNADDPLVGDPIGAAALSAGLAHEMIPYSPEELIDIANREFSWCESQLATAATAMGTTPKGAIEKIKLAHVPPGGQPALAVAEANRSINFLKQHHLVSIPPFAEEIWRLEMIPPDAQKTMPYAVYGQPAMRVAYPTDSMPHDDKIAAMRGNNRHFMRIVTPHELIPGHHLQRFASARNRTWRSLFYTPFYVEGWALHWEMLFWDLNYAESPEDRAGMLFWRMHRCARIIVSLRFHLGSMSPDEMIAFLTDRVGHEKSGATSEVRRYIGGSYGPLYQAAYMLGGLQLRALHKDLVTSGTMSPRDFHDAVLAQNAIPIELIRAALTKNPPARDWQPSWRFANP
ncbi:MAG: Uncharacterized conserved protein, DUF885 familyt [Verrucomicrobia bacterium]|nr:MAG: Uncharacterized conserved protein, DUF885 familyt [Verrucomicrobiota bacterium]